MRTSLGSYKLLRILTPVLEQSSTKILDAEWEPAEPAAAPNRTIGSEDESDESKGDLYCSRNSLGYRNCRLPGPRRQRCKRPGEECPGRHTVWGSCQYQ